MADLLSEFLAHAKPPKQRAVKTPKTNVERFLESLETQIETFKSIGKPGFKRDTKTQWFSENEDGSFLLQFGRPKISLGKDAEGKDINYLVPPDKDTALDLLVKARALVEENEEIRKAIDTAYNAPSKSGAKIKPVAPTTPTESRKRSRGPNKPKVTAQNKAAERGLFHLKR